MTRPWEASTKTGLEVSHDASKIDVDVTLEDPHSTQHFLESVLTSFTKTVGIPQPSAIAKPEALGRLVLASGGVPRDYLNLVAASLGVARQKRATAAKIGREDVAIAAGKLAAGKKSDLEQDVAKDAATIIQALDDISRWVKSEGFTYFRVNVEDREAESYETLSLLTDLRFIHFLQVVSDQHKSGVRYESYVLDLSEYSDVRLQRKLHILDLEAGHWTLRRTGEGRRNESLSATQLRDRLRQSPILELRTLLGFSQSGV